MDEPFEGMFLEFCGRFLEVIEAIQAISWILNIFERLITLDNLVFFSVGNSGVTKATYYILFTHVSPQLWLCLRYVFRWLKTFEDE